jgi:hypothetical protein
VALPVVISGGIEWSGASVPMIGPESAGMEVPEKSPCCRGNQPGPAPTLSASIPTATPRRASKDKVAIACTTSLALGALGTNFDRSSMFPANWWLDSDTWRPCNDATGSHVPSPRHAGWQTFRMSLEMNGRPRYAACLGQNRTVEGADSTRG